MEASQELKGSLANWGHIVFVSGCIVSFFVALVFALEVPWKFALIAGLTPIGVFFVVLFLLFCVFKLKLATWKKHYDKVSLNENYTRSIKALLLPILLAGLYFYIKEEEGENTLYTKSPVNCEMIIHPCGSSYKKNSTDVWDAADLISQPSENEILIITNSVFGLEQHRGECAQTGAYCSTENINPGRKSLKWMEKTSWSFAHELTRSAIWNPVSCPVTDSDLEDDPGVCEPGILYDNGIQTDVCIDSRLCGIRGWCPPIRLDNFPQEAIFKTDDFTIFLDLKPNFPEFRAPSWSRGGKGGYSANYADIYAKYHNYEKSVSTCLFNPKSDPYCPRFRLEDIVMLADVTDNDFNETAKFGGQYKIEIVWSCGFDWEKDIYDCLPKFNFINRATNKGKPKIYPKVTAQTENSRMVNYNLGITVSILLSERANKFIYLIWQCTLNSFMSRLQ
ncbi:P2X purinoceptor 6 isoform X2 [Folsomia candida]|nr:P2X purinoceptor 6 isoform X2 [Folsomia candida]